MSTVHNPSRGGGEYGRGHTTIHMGSTRGTSPDARPETRWEQLHRWLLYPKSVRDALCTKRKIMEARRSLQKW